MSKRRPKANVFCVSQCICGIQDLYQSVAQTPSGICVPASKAQPGAQILGVLVGLEVGGIAWICQLKGGAVQ